MKTLIIAALAAALGTAAFANGHGKEPPGQRDNNWGETTRDFIAGGFDQGGHASDPSGDGKGKEDRVGLPNVAGQGDLSATMDALGF